MTRFLIINLVKITVILEITNMQLNHKLYKFISKKKTSAGYTLTELLIGAAIATVVIGAAGFGLVQMMRTSQKGGEETERRQEISRAYTFISDEIRRAELIEPNADNAGGFSESGDVVLALKIPGIDNDGDSTTESRVVYYVKNKEDDFDDAPVWEGPEILYRWGPPLDNSGNYTAGAWSAEAILDELSSTITTPSCETGDSGTTDDDWTASAAPGFAACIDPDNKTAQLFINGNIVTSGNIHDGTYKSADTKTVARANSDNSTAGGTFPNSIRDLDGWFTCRTPQNGVPQSVITGITFYDTSGSAISGSSVTADDGSTLNPTKTVSVGGSSQFGEYKKDKMKVYAISQGCQQTLNGTTVIQDVAPVSVDITINSPTNITYSGDTSKIKHFRNGDVLDTELVENSFGDQDTFIKFLKDRGVEITWVDTDGDTLGGVDGEEDGDDEYTIVLDSDELLIAFEIGQDSATFANGDTNPGFDFQDKLVLIKSDYLAP